MNCRTSRVWHDPLSRLDLTAATQQPAAAMQQHCCCYRPLARTNKQTNIQTSGNDNKAHSLRTWRN